MLHIFRRRRPRSGVTLAVTLAGEPAFLLDLDALMAGRASGIYNPEGVLSPQAGPVFPGGRDGSRMQSLATFRTTPTVGVWIGSPGAFDPREPVEK